MGASRRVQPARLNIARFGYRLIRPEPRGRFRVRDATARVARHTLLYKKARFDEAIKLISWWMVMCGFEPQTPYMRSKLRAKKPFTVY